MTRNHYLLMLAWLVAHDRYIKPMLVLADASSGEPPTQNPNVTISYVMEPFDTVSKGLIRTPSTSLRLHLSWVEEFAFIGEAALQVVYDFNRGGEEDIYFGVIEDSRPHNCYGSTNLSFWYKVLGPTLCALQITLYEDTDCVVRNHTNCAQGDNLKPFSMKHETILSSLDFEWHEVVMPLPFLDKNGDELDLRRIRGWKIHVVQQNTTETSVERNDTLHQSVTLSATGAFLIDQLACHGGGALFGAPFHVVPAFDLQAALQQGLWMSEVHESNISEIETSLVVDAT